MPGKKEERRYWQAQGNRFPITIYPLTTIGDWNGVIELCTRYERENGRLPLSDQSWIELHTSRDAPSVKTPTGYVARDSRSGDVVAYLHLSVHAGGSTIEIVISSDPGRSEEVARELIKRCLADLEPGRYPLYLWTSPQNGYMPKVAESLGMSKHRELYQMRKPLAIEASGQAGMEGVGGDLGGEDEGTGNREGALLRTFQPGKDEASWLELNNRCFVEHPDQSNWTMDDLLVRENEPWFDAQGFILCEYGGNLAGSCWTKIHPTTEPDGQPAGEIYVICTDPEYQGKGIGGLLLRAGLEYFDRHSLPAAMLYVESTNDPALALYRRQGFSLHSITTQYSLFWAAPPRQRTGT